MKICAIICEYNPFHNGHLYQLQEAKRRSGADALLCIMSGNFVQRGEAAIMDKYTRAKHAVLAGADAVVELPTVFATSNAELFAKGGIKLLSSIPAVTTLCFGAEKENKNAFLQAATLLNNEPKEVSDAIKALVKTGVSYAKARAIAYQDLLDNELINSPNNILGIEYTRALLAMQSGVEILPIQRVGGGYKENELQQEFSSATAIRSAIENGTPIDKQLPAFVEKDLPKRLCERLETLEKYALLSKNRADIAKTCDCTEGLENALQKTAESGEPLVETLTSARYTASRIRRIALQNLLNIEENLIRDCLQSPLYLRVLAVKKERSDVLSALGESDYPIIARAHDENCLLGAAKRSFERDTFAEKTYSLLYPQKTNKNIFI